MLLLLYVVLRRISNLPAIHDDTQVLLIYTQFHVVREFVQVLVICFVLGCTEGDF